MRRSILCLLAASLASALRPQLNRRAFGAVAVAAPAVVAGPALGAAAALEIPSATVPYYTLLIPIVELGDAVKSWARAADAGGDSANVGRALEALCKGSILSSKNFYLGVGTKYASAIRYDDFDKRLVEADKNARLSAIVLAAESIERARKRFAAGDDASAAAGDLAYAGERVDDFLSRVPKKDVAAARAALLALRGADANADGTVDDAEFYAPGALTDEVRLAATWGVWGTTLYSADLRPQAPGSDFLLRVAKPPTVPDELKRLIARSEF